MNVLNKLSDLEVGQNAIIDAIDSSSPVSIRLQEFGFLPGTPIQLIRKAPLGDPLEVKVRGTSLSLRAQEASAISIRSE